MYYLLHETASTRVASADRLAADPERHGTHAHLAGAQGTRLYGAARWRLPTACGGRSRASAAKSGRRVLARRGQRVVDGRAGALGGRSRRLQTTVRPQRRLRRIAQVLEARQPQRGIAGRAGPRAAATKAAARVRRDSGDRLLSRRGPRGGRSRVGGLDRKSTRLNSSHRCISYAVFCLKKKKKRNKTQ